VVAEDSLDAIQLEKSIMFYATNHYTTDGIKTIFRANFAIGRCQIQLPYHYNDR
jgi:hypothetical protein